MIVKTLQSFLSFLIRNRQSGHTTLVNKLAKENDVYVIVHNTKAKEIFDKDVQEKLYTINQFQRLLGKDKKPILVDNATLHKLFTDALLEMGKQEEIIAHQKKTLSTIGQVIAISNKMSPHTGHRIRVIDPTM